MDIVLTDFEISELDKQDPAKEKGGGFQRLLVRFQRRIDRSTGKLTLTESDLTRIPMYAFDYKTGGWEAQLVAAFGRTLGPKLGR